MSLIRRRIGPDRDSGQLPTALIILVFFGMLIVLFWIMLPIGEATDQKAGSQAAADAAALAAAQQIGDDLPDVITTAAARATDTGRLLDLFSDLAGGYGREAAIDFANRNGSSVTAYNYARAVDQVEVTVQERRATVNGDHAASRARAAIGLRLG